MPVSDAALRNPTMQMFASAAFIREVEQRLLDLFAAGKLFGTVHTCIGQELTRIAVAHWRCRAVFEGQGSESRSD